MSNNFFKSSSVVQESEVRVINSNDIVAKQLESIVQYVNRDDTENVENVFSQGIGAKEVAVLLKETEGDPEVVESIIKSDKSDRTEAQIVSEIASDLIGQATLEAEEIVESAKKEALEIKNEAFQAGSEQGYEEGLRKGKEEIALEKKKLEQQEKELEQRKKDLEAEYRNLANELEPQLVDVITGVYEHVLGATLEEHREIVLHLVNSTLFQMDSSKKFVLHVSKEDYPFISLKKKELVSGTGTSVDNLEIMEDFSMKRGQCIIETAGAIFDCGFKTQMEELRKELKLLSYEHK